MTTDYDFTTHMSILEHLAVEVAANGDDHRMLLHVRKAGEGQPALLLVLTNVDQVWLVKADVTVWRKHMKELGMPGLDWEEMFKMFRKVVQENTIKAEIKDKETVRLVATYALGGPVGLELCSNFDLKRVLTEKDRNSELSNCLFSLLHLSKKAGSGDTALRADLATAKKRITEQQATITQLERDLSTARYAGSLGGDGFDMLGSIQGDAKDNAASRKRKDTNILHPTQRRRKKKNLKIG
eukprot:gb/GEZN01016142.1/.p1 GENE.gb/GEZN01016142.1/~~gb/GEZN01016142.1/.p1  ORF type:complete len:240 (-),score=28.16 gb/GEZN01016142.1/:111-830(-)